MIVKDFALTVWKPEEIKVLISGDSYELISGYTDGVDTRLLELLGDYVVDSFKSDGPNKYTVWVLERPVKISDL